MNMPAMRQPVRIFLVLCLAVLVQTGMSAPARAQDRGSVDKNEQPVEEKKELPGSAEKKAETGDGKTTTLPETKVENKAPVNIEAPVKDAEAKAEKKTATKKPTATVTKKKAAEQKPVAKKQPAPPAKKKTEVKKKEKAAPVKKKTPPGKAQKPQEKPVVAAKKGNNKSGDEPAAKKEEEKAGGEKDDKKADIFSGDAAVKEALKDKDKGAEKKEEAPVDKKEAPLEKKDDVAASDNAPRQPRIIVINPGAPEAASFSRTWGPLVGGTDIYAWGRGLGLYLKDDADPVLDRQAAFVSLHGTYVTVKDLQHSAIYTLWLDLAAFRNPENKAFPAMLKIFMRSGRHDYRLVYSCPFPYGGDGPIRIEIPWEMSAEGEITILLRELSSMKRAWGIWDMIITDTSELPLSPELYRRYHEPVKLPIKEKILE